MQMDALSALSRAFCVQNTQETSIACNTSFAELLTFY